VITLYKHILEGLCNIEQLNLITIIYTTLYFCYFLRVKRTGQIRLN
jgi:hypothetical protein